MVSVVILTINEELDLPKCLSSLYWTDDIHVVDSGSTDSTIEIASNFSANTYFNPFVSFGQQRNFSLDNLKFKYDWILFLDADEVSTPKFYTEIMHQISNCDDNIAGFYCCWKMMLEDKWLKHCDNFPKWQFRLLKKGMARFVDFGHGQKEEIIYGSASYIMEPYLHFGFSKGWSQWINRHNRYSSLEAFERSKNKPPLKNIFSNHGSIRNPALKSWLSLLPGWPILRFVHSYIFNLGFLEGIPGLIYCINISYYEFLIQIKIRELNKKC